MIEIRKRSAKKVDGYNDGMKKQSGENIFDHVMRSMAHDDAWQTTQPTALFRDEHGRYQKHKWTVRPIPLGRMRIYSTEKGEQEHVGGVAQYSMPVKMTAQMLRFPTPEDQIKLDDFKAKIRTLQDELREFERDAWLRGKPLTEAQVREQARKNKEAGIS